MFLLTSPVCGLFKWRQFEPGVILLAVGWYLRLSLSYRGARGTPCRARTFGRSRHHLEVGAALRPGNGTTFALETQTDER
jgi:transposase-like protein